MAGYVCSRCRGCKNYTDIDTNIYDIPEYSYNECSGSENASFAWECDAYKEAHMRVTKPIKENTSVEDTVETVDQKIDKIKEYVEKINKLVADLESIKNEPKQEDASASYHIAINNQAWYINNNAYNNDSIEWTSEPAFSKDNPFCYYPNKEYAEKALRLQKLNNAMLAFKYCYDTDYEPDWEDTDDERKYYVFYHYLENTFKVDFDKCHEKNVVYFSTGEIARGCAKWLNETFNKE